MRDIGPVTPEEAKAEIDKVEHWRHQIEVAPGVVTPGSQDSGRRLDFLELPDDLSGKRVLDIGASDGFFSFACEARGAEVLAIDARPIGGTGFTIAKKLLGSSVEHRVMNVYDLSPDDVGAFDIVLFLGVLYHLRYPMLGLDKMAAVCRPGARVWAASLVIDGLVAGPDQTLPEIAPGLSEVPIAQFYPGTKLDEAHSSYWGPNLAAFKSMVEESGFTIERVKLPGKTAPRRALLQMQRS